MDKHQKPIVVSVMTLYATLVSIWQFYLEVFSANLKLFCLQNFLNLHLCTSYISKLCTSLPSCTYTCSIEFETNRVILRWSITENVFSHTHTLSLSLSLFSSSKEVNYILPKSIIIFLLCPALTGPLIDSWKPLRWNPCMCLNRCPLLLQCARDNQFVCIRPRKCRYLSKAHTNISFPGHVLIWKLRR